MSRQHVRGWRPSPALVVAMAVLIVSLSSTATAAHLLITSSEIKDGTIQLVDIGGKAKASLHARAKRADSATALTDVASRGRIVASSTPRAGALLPLSADGDLPASVLPLDSTSKAPNIAARVYGSHDQLTHLQIAGAPVQLLTFDQVSFDTAHLFDPAHPTQLKTSVAGIYLITANVSWAIEGNRLNGVNRAVYLYVDGHAVAVDQRPPADETRQTVTTIFRLEAGDTVEVGAAQDAGDLTANAVGDYAPSLALAWIAPG